MKVLLGSIYILILSSFVFADDLDQYIRLGFDNNLALKQKEFDYNKSIHALREARGLFFPALSIEARYTRAGGGREIEFPVGDLLNPVYSTLNQLTGSQSFPQLENESIPFLREKEQETKLRLVQPMFNHSIYSNFALKDALSKSSQEKLSGYKEELVKEITTAYYQYIQALKIKDLYLGTLELVDESVRVSQVLFENDMVTQDAVYRSKAEKLKTEQQIISANHKYVLARSYFNFLINRDLEADIDIDEKSFLPLNTMDLKTAETQALHQRKELRQLGYAIEASQKAVQIASAGYYPGLTFVADYGIQGSKYDFDSDHDYWMASAVLSWNLFNGFQDSEKRQQAEINSKILQTQLLELKQNIRLQVKNAYHELHTAYKSYQSAKVRQDLDNETYTIIARKYEQGLAAQIELIDARVNMTNSQIGTVVNYYGYLIKDIEFRQISGALTSENSGDKK